MLSFARKGALCVVGAVLVAIGCSRQEPVDQEPIGHGSSAVVAGLVAAYGFEEGTGTTTADATGNHLDGALTGGAWTRGKFGNALRLNGEGDWVTVTDAPALHLTTGMTLSAWVFPTSPLPIWSSAIMKETQGDFAYALYANSSDAAPGAFVLLGGEEHGKTGGSLVPVGAWTYLATTYDGSTLSLYVNDVLVATQAVAGGIDVSTGALRIGGDSIWGEFFAGLIDEVRIYNRPLSVSEIATDMNSSVAPAGRSRPRSSWPRTASRKERERPPPTHRGTTSMAR